MIKSLVFCVYLFCIFMPYPICLNVSMVSDRHFKSQNYLIPFAFFSFKITITTKCGINKEVGFKKEKKS